MRAAAFAGTFADMLALPPPKLAALEADHGRAAQNPERRGHRIDDLGRIRRAKQRIPKSAGLRLEFVPTLERLSAARARIRPLRRIVVRPCRRIAGIFRIAGWSAVEPVDGAERIVPGDGEAHARTLSGRDAYAPRERAVLRLAPHLRGRARLVVTPLRQEPGLCKSPPIAAETVEPLAAHVVVDMLDPVPLRRDREIAPLCGRAVQVRGCEMQRAVGAVAREDMDAAVAAIVSERAG